MFTYTTDASASAENDDAQYFRQYVFDTLNDGAGNTAPGWLVTNYGNGAEPTTASLPGPQGLSNAAAPQVLTTTVTLAANLPAASSQPAFLPLMYPATAIQVKGRWLADQDLMVYSSGGASTGQSYTERSLNVDPSAAQLKQLGTLDPAPGLAPDLALPGSYKTPALERLAKKYAGGQKTEIGEMNALADWLSGSQFGYSLAGPVFNTAGGLLEFLTQTRSGYCVQSAYAMTVLARLLDVPARFVVGYTAGTRVKGNEYKVMNTDAHAWTEVYFPTFGWLRFEPTPAGQGTAHATNYMDNASGTSHVDINGPPNAKATEAPGQENSSPAQKKFRGGQQDDTGALTRLSGKAAGTPWAATLLAVIAAIALACGFIAMVAPPTQRALTGSATSRRRRRPVSATSVTLVLVAAALLALALYRLLSRPSGLHLSAAWATVGIAFGAAAALALIAPSTIRLVLRRGRWMRADDDASRAHVAWRELRDDLTDLGVGCRASDPPRTLAQRVTAELPEPAADAIRRLALAEERATYAARPSGSEQLRQDGSTARRGLAASVGRGARWRARLFPISVLTTLADLAVAVPDALVTRAQGSRWHIGSRRRDATAHRVPSR